MSYIPLQDRVDRLLSSQGDGTGVTDMAVDGKAITGATTAAPTVVTATAHGYVVGDWIFIDGATGTTEINGLRQVATVPNANTFTLLDEAGDSVGSAGTFGGTVDSNIAIVYKPTLDTHIHQIASTASDASVVVDGLLGLARLASLGIVVAVWEGSSGALTTLATIRSWSDWALLSGGGQAPITWADAAVIEAASRWELGDVGKGHGWSNIQLHAADGDFLVFYTDEDLAGLVSMRAMAQGHEGV